MGNIDWHLYSLDAERSADTATLSWLYVSVRSLEYPQAWGGEGSVMTVFQEKQTKEETGPPFTASLD
jgi:hypothetical protein